MNVDVPTVYFLDYLPNYILVLLIHQPIKGRMPHALHMRSISCNFPAVQPWLSTCPIGIICASFKYTTLPMCTGNEQNMA